MAPFFEVSFQSDSEVTQVSPAGDKKRRHQEISGTMAAQQCHAKKRLLDFGRKSEEYNLQDDAVSGITMAESESEYDPPSSSSQSGEGIGGYAATCCSSNMGFSPEVQKSPISYESDAESCGSNSPEPEQEGGFDALDFAEQLLMLKDDEDDWDWKQYLSPDMDFLLEEEVSFDNNKVSDLLMAEYNKASTSCQETCDSQMWDAADLEQYLIPEFSKCDSPELFSGNQGNWEQYVGFSQILPF